MTFNVPALKVTVVVSDHWEKLAHGDMIQFSSVQSLSRVRLFATPWTAACQAPLSLGDSPGKILEWVAVLSSRGSSQPRD